MHLVLKQWDQEPEPLERIGKGIVEAQGGSAVAELSQLDRAFTAVMNRFIQTGHAPHYTELAGALDLSVEDGRAKYEDRRRTSGHKHKQRDRYGSTRLMPGIRSKSVS